MKSKEEWLEYLYDLDISGDLEIGIECDTCGGSGELVSDYDEETEKCVYYRCKDCQESGVNDYNFIELLDDINYLTQQDKNAIIKPEDFKYFLKNNHIVEIDKAFENTKKISRIPTDVIMKFLVNNRGNMNDYKMRKKIK